MLVSDASGWVFYSRGSQNGSRYKAVHKAMTFDAAQDHCNKFGGYLARVNTIREQVFLEEFLNLELQKEGILLCIPFNFYFFSSSL